MKREIEFFIERMLDLSAAPASDFDYVEEGHLDSMALMHLVVALEDRFDIEIVDEDIVSGEFRTFGGLVMIVMRAMDARAAA